MGTLHGWFGSGLPWSMSLAAFSVSACCLQPQVMCISLFGMVQVQRFKHPLLLAEFSHVPEEQRQLLERCCCCGSSGRPRGCKLADAWVSVKCVEQPATGTSHSSTTLMIGSKQLHCTLDPTFHQAANRRYGLWACKSCAFEHGHGAAPPLPAPPPPQAPEQPASTAPPEALPHHIAAPAPPLQQQQRTMLTRQNRDEFKAEIQRRSGERRQLLANMEQLQKQQGLSLEHQQALEGMLTDLQNELQQAQEELQVLKQAAQDYLGAQRGRKLTGVKRTRERLEG